jgi:hypothetical protein
LSRCLRISTSGPTHHRFEPFFTELDVHETRNLLNHRAVIGAELLDMARLAAKPAVATDSLGSGAASNALRNSS